MRLEFVQEIEEEILSTKAELETLRTALPTSRLDGLPHGTATASKVEVTAMRIEFLERRLEELAAEYDSASVILTEEIFQRVTRKLGKAGKVLFLHYVMGKTPSEIADGLCCTRPTIYKLLAQGRQEFSLGEPPSPRNITAIFAPDDRACPSRVQTGFQNAYS